MASKRGRNLCYRRMFSRLKSSLSHRLSHHWLFVVNFAQISPGASVVNFEKQENDGWVTIFSVTGEVSFHQCSNCFTKTLVNDCRRIYIHWSVIGDFISYWYFCWRISKILMTSFQEHLWSHCSEREISFHICSAECMLWKYWDGPWKISKVESIF